MMLSWKLQLMLCVILNAEVDRDYSLDSDYILSVGISMLWNFNNKGGHEHDLKRGHQMVVGPQFDEFPEFHHLPQRLATVPWFGSSFQMVTAKSEYVLCARREDEDRFDGYLAAHKDLDDASEASRFEIEPRFHRNSVMITVGFQIGTPDSSPFFCTCFPGIFLQNMYRWMARNPGFLFEILQG